MWRPVLVVLAVALAGCARPPQPIAGAFPEVTVGEAQQYDHNGERVRWGGSLVSTPTNDAGETCFQVLSRPLDRRARPMWTDQTYGRFIACRGGFYDPAIYAANREITITGTIDGSRAGRIGDADYTFPLLRADSVYLWPVRPVVVDYDGGYYDPGYGWGVGYGGFSPYYYGGPYWGPYWGWGWGGYWPGYWGGGWGGYWGGRRYWGGRYWGGGRGYWGGGHRGGGYYGGGRGGGGGGRGGGGGGGGGGRGGGGGGGRGR